VLLQRNYDKYFTYKNKRSFSRKTFESIGTTVKYKNSLIKVSNWLKCQDRGERDLATNLNASFF
jgi:hypothetical protein